MFEDGEPGAETRSNARRCDVLQVAFNRALNTAVARGQGIACFAEVERHLGRE